VPRNAFSTEAFFQRGGKDVSARRHAFAELLLAARVIAAIRGL